MLPERHLWSGLRLRDGRVPEHQRVRSVRRLRTAVLCRRGLRFRQLPLQRDLSVGAVHDPPAGAPRGIALPHAVEPGVALLQLPHQGLKVGEQRPRTDVFPGRFAHDLTPVAGGPDRENAL